MIVDDLRNADLYRGIPALHAVLTSLAAMQGGELPTAPVELDGGMGRLLPMEFVTRDPTACRFENHLTYYDIHCVFEGVERVEVAALGSLTPSTEFDEGDDIGFLDGGADASVVLSPGRFLACFPDDAHKPGMWIDGPRPLRKIVAKVRVSSLFD
ncbi:MAG: YhcH/YjgK/YiaL family protein [Arachnia sp.]